MCACAHLLGYGVPVQVALALVHALLVQELALVGDEQGVADEFSHCGRNDINIYKKMHNRRLKPILLIALRLVPR